MMEVVIAILAVIFVLGVAINIHEFGHFIIAKLFRMRVEAYSFFGLGPRIWGFKIGHTDYRISAIPLGAYVKLYGDEATASLEGGVSKEEEVPKHELYELRPRWQKFLVMIGGPLMNILLALAIPFIIALTYGVPSNPAPIIGFVKPGGEAEKAGLKPGDRIVKFDGIENPTWRRIERDALLMPEKPIPITVEREGSRVDLFITPVKVVENGQAFGILDFEPDLGAEPVVVGRLEPSMPAAQSGLQVGDWVVSVNGKPVRNRQEMKKLINEAKDQPIRLSVVRNGERLEIETRAVQKDNDWLIGIGFNNNLSSARESVGILGALNFAWETNMEILRMTAKAFGQVSTGERSARDTVAGPIGIVQIIVQMVTSAGFLGLLSLLGIISLNLGIFNLLPIPLLDGGQIMMLGIEKVYSMFGKTMSMAIKERIQMVGLVLILILIILTTFNDISRLFR
ncbi:MAG: RIP metalloprotease RseP [Acidobacteria bacterium]|jgi:regulator of sigma E protease|nr:MAG: RIP metalloprotease RseP [Acidobacteriota bacterium]GIU82363.1 MAG: putative zinc metalloprotease [Pyrinomonadaceae bacterium]